MAYDGQQATLVRDSSSMWVSTWLKASGQVSGPMLTTVSVLVPSQPCNHHVVTASGWQRKFGLTLMPYPGFQATISAPGPHRQNAEVQSSPCILYGVTSGIQEVIVPVLESGDL